MTDTTLPTHIRATGSADDQATDAPWWADHVVYQIYPRSFQDSNGDGIGDLRGIRSRLDHLERLGVGIIWLSPIYRSPHADNGYDISDYQAIDPIYGSLDDFDELLGDVHRRGMRLILDLVVNHTSDEHPWFIESKSSRSNPKRDWYWWRPARPGHTPGEPGAEPTNWRSFFSGPTWDLDETTGEYYLHLFDRKQPDLNWENPEVRSAIYEMMRWWLDRGIDGFRMDVINLISKRPELPDGIADPDGLGDGFPHYSSGPRIHDYLQEMHREVFAGRNDRLLTVGEMPGVNVEDARLFTDPARNELNMVFQFDHVSLDHGVHKFDPRKLDLRELKRTLFRWQAGLHQTGWNSLYWSNHDQPRAVSRFGDDQHHWRESATALATVLHLLRGTPFIYQGEELGMTNLEFESAEAFNDIESRNHWDEACRAGADADATLAGLRAMSRDNARSPIQWSAELNAGFSAATPWTSVHPNSAWLNAEAQYTDPDSVFRYYQKLISLRRTEPAVSNGSCAPLDLDHPSILSYERALDNRTLLVIANLSSTATAYSLPQGWAESDLILANTPATGAVFGPWDSRVYRLIET